MPAPNMPGKQCASCRLQLPHTAKFCPRCHATLRLPPNQSPAPKRPTANLGTASLGGNKNKTQRVAGQIPVASKAVTAALLCAAAFAVPTLLKTGEVLAEVAAHQTSLQRELSLAQSALIEATDKAAPDSHPDARWLTAIGQRLVNALPMASPYKASYRFHVIPSDDINAFAVPGGEIFVYRGLLDQLERRPDLVAAVLAHEIQHVERRHGLRSFYQALSVGAVTLWTFGLSNDFGETLSRALINTRYSRHLESEADERALNLLQAAQFPTRAMPEALLKLAESRQSWQPPVWLSSHPHPTHRANTLLQRMDTKVN